MINSIDDINLFELSPIENIGGICFKRNDKFAPFGSFSCNGDKLRQAIYIIKDLISKGVNGIVTAGTVSSPQSLIVATVCNYFDIPYTVFYGGTTPKSLYARDSFKLLSKYKPVIKFSNCARTNAIYKDVRKYASENNYGVIEYGMKYSDDIMEIPAYQVNNFGEYRDIVITCGSGNTAKGIIYGLSKYGIKYNKIYLFAVGPNREALIRGFASDINFDLKMEYIDLFNTIGFDYNKRLNITYNGVRLHPNYEAKAFNALQKRYKLDNPIFYINGSEIQL